MADTGDGGVEIKKGLDLPIDGAPGTSIEDGSGDRVLRGHRHGFHRPETKNVGGGGRTGRAWPTAVRRQAVRWRGGHSTRRRAGPGDQSRCTQGPPIRGDRRR